MGSKYGTKWYRNFPSDGVLKLAKEEWKKMLSKFTLEQTRKALDECLTVHPTFSPTAGEFAELINGKANAEWIPPDVPLVAHIPKTAEEVKEGKKRGLENLAEMRAELGI